jgi:phosphate transport system substrate-binding protein
MRTGFPSVKLALLTCTLLTVTASVNAKQSLTGEIRIDGSSTVFPIMEAVSEEYAHEQPKVKTPISISGTGGGFNRFVRGKTDLNNASRPIKDEEMKIANENKVKYTEFRIAYDGLSIIVNRENTWVKNLTIEDLRTMWSESGTVKRWSDIHPDWPHERIRFYAPGVDSGTYDYFEDVVLNHKAINKSVTLSEDDNVLIRGVMSDKYAIAFLGYAYYSENQMKVKAVPVNSILPTKETIKSGAYTPLSRPLYVYVNCASIRNNNSIYDYVRFTLTHAGILAEEVGYVALPEYQYRQQLQELERIKR